MMTQSTVNKFLKMQKTITVVLWNWKCLQSLFVGPLVCLEKMVLFIISLSPFFSFQPCKTGFLDLRVSVWVGGSESQSSNSLK